jgi:hypothetical protein
MEIMKCPHKTQKHYAKVNLIKYLNHIGYVQPLLPQVWKK